MGLIVEESIETEGRPRTIHRATKATNTTKVPGLIGGHTLVSHLSHVSQASDQAFLLTSHKSQSDAYDPYPGDAPHATEAVEHPSRITGDPTPDPFETATRSLIEAGIEFKEIAP